jgi:hypothetical protein
MVRLLGERNRQLDIHVRDQHPETQAIRHALAEDKRRLAQALAQLIEAQRGLSVAQRRMIDDLRRRDNSNNRIGCAASALGAPARTWPHGRI